VLDLVVVVRPARRRVVRRRLIVRPARRRVVRRRLLVLVVGADDLGALVVAVVVALVALLVRARGLPLPRRGEGGSRELAARHHDGFRVLDVRGARGRAGAGGGGRASLRCVLWRSSVSRSGGADNGRNGWIPSKQVRAPPHVILRVSGNVRQQGRARGTASQLKCQTPVYLLTGVRSSAWRMTRQPRTPRRRQVRRG